MRPHQVALPACRCLCHNFLTMHVFCNGEALIVDVHALPLLCHNDVDMTVFRSPKLARREIPRALIVLRPSQTIS